MSCLSLNSSYKVLIDYTGNHTRLIFTELEKLKTYALGKTVNGDMVKELVSESAANSLQLANAIRLRGGGWGWGSYTS